MKTLDVLKHFEYKVENIDYFPDGNIFHMNYNQCEISFKDQNGQVECVTIIKNGKENVFKNLIQAFNYVTEKSTIKRKKTPINIESFFILRVVPGKKRIKEFKIEIKAHTENKEQSFFLSHFLDWVNKSNKRIIPEPSSYQEFLNWFKPLCQKFKPRFYDGKFHIRKTPQTELEFLEEWEKRPKTNIKYFANHEFRNFVTYKPSPKYSVRVDSHGIDWFNVSIELEEELKNISLEQIDALLQSKNTKIVEIPNSGGVKYLRKDLKKISKIAKDLQDLGIVWNQDKQDLHTLQIIGAPASEIKNQLFKFSKDFQGFPKLEIDEKIGLRDYQKSGVEFIHWSCDNFGGCLLADDMGLGKTVQVLTSLTLLKEEGPSLVICPSSIVHNWKREANKFFPNLKVRVIERGENRQQELSKNKDYDIIIYNYHLARRDIDYLSEIKWKCVIVDEAQAIKNPKSDISLCVKKIPSKYRIALTGTPIENRLSDIQSIVDFAIPRYLPKTKDAGFIRGRIKPICIRRTKNEVAKDLPDKIEENIICEMTHTQKQIYNFQLEKTRKLLENPEESNMICVLAEITKLRQICCHPELLGYESDSGKINVLLENIQSILDSGNKVLVFSQFVQMLKKIEKKLEAMNFPYYMLTGQTENRQELVDKFEKDKDPSVFLISLKAGGVGLNLTSASYVILYDPWWNPAIEYQAIDRAHRIGQNKNVVALKLIAKDSIEEKIMQLQEQKMTLVKNVLGTNGFNHKLSNDDFKFILS